MYSKYDKFDTAKELVEYALDRLDDEERNKIVIVGDYRLTLEVIKVLFGEYNFDAESIELHSDDNIYAVEIDDGYMVMVDGLKDNDGKFKTVNEDENIVYLIDGDVNCKLLLANPYINYSIFDIGDDFFYTYGEDEDEPCDGDCEHCLYNDIEIDDDFFE